MNCRVCGLDTDRHSRTDFVECLKSAPRLPEEEYAPTLACLLDIADNYSALVAWGQDIQNFSLTFSNGDTITTKDMYRAIAKELLEHYYPQKEVKHERRRKRTSKKVETDTDEIEIPEDEELPF